MIFNEDERLMLSGPGAEWRSTFQIKYMIIDFDLSVCSKDKRGPGQEFLVESYERLHYACYPPPEVKQSGLFDPYAADVFQTGKMLRHEFRVSDALHQRANLTPRRRILKD
jgi:hypothetical protein